MANCWIDVGSNGRLTWSFHGSDEKELTLPQLRDLVVLKRNDVKDATHTCENDFKYICIDERWHLMTTDGWFPVSVNPKALKPIQTVQAVLNDLDELREEYKDYNKDPALISGAEAYDLIGKRVDVEALCSQGDGTFKWEDAKHLPACDILNDGFDFRLKPTTLKVNAELPKPNKETQHNSLVYAVTYEFKSREERNAFANKLRGTNS